MSLASKIVIIRGDGIGPEVVEEGVKILKVISKYTDFKFKFHKASAGAGVYKKHGTPLPEKSFDIIKNSDAILFGSHYKKGVR
ncbi:MAG: isocitrate/isopropylmalate family dehydrogenase [Promethearchaeota archaeon]